jgi:hypothetical protein
VANPHGLEENIAVALETPASPFDSHPAPAERIARIRALAAPGIAASPDDETGAWRLFPDRERLERLMTVFVRDDLAQRRRLGPRSGGPVARRSWIEG